MKRFHVRYIPRADFNWKAGARTHWCSRHPRKQGLESFGKFRLGSENHVRLYKRDKNVQREETLNTMAKKMPEIYEELAGEGDVIWKVR